MVSKIDELIEAVQSTDWVMVVVTAVSSFFTLVITIYIACNQIKIQKKQLRMERQKSLQEPYAYMLDLKDLAHSFGYYIYKNIFNIIYGETNPKLLEQIHFMYDKLSKSEEWFTKVRSQLLTIKMMDVYINDIEQIYSYMAHSVDMYRAIVVCACVKPEVFDKSESKYKICAGHIIRVYHEITKEKKNEIPSEITGKRLADMIETIKQYLRITYDENLFSDVPNAERIKIIYELAKYFNDVFANELRKSLIEYDKINNKLFLENEIDKIIEKEITNA